MIMSCVKRSSVTVTGLAEHGKKTDQPRPREVIEGYVDDYGNDDSDDDDYVIVCSVGQA